MEYKTRELTNIDYTIGPCIENILRRKPKLLDDEALPRLFLESRDIYDEFTPTRI